ncbi:MAG: electron transfer flavoprotein alpha subunit [Candidatus Tokpelaia sp. JSC188]|nr:MAG: electron transfer flavoprotein alpha subunit [Candidatus Tokpelaia sp. JSC188]
MAILLLAEHDNQRLAIETAKTLTAAREIGSDIDILVAGMNTNQVAVAATKLLGVRKVLVAETFYLQYQLAEPLTYVIISLADSYDVFIAPATAMGKNVMPRLAGQLGVAQISEIISVVSHDIFKRPTYAGNAIETVQALDAKKVITVRTTSFMAANAGKCNVEIEKVVIPEDPSLSRFVSQIDSSKGQPELNSALVVVSGGRGFGSSENFKMLLEPLAKRLKAAIGASRAAVDAGYASNDRQVGQTGKSVSPELYIAIGISGAIQHLAGIMDSRVIVAINKDPEAPIFRVADYGFVGDLFEIVPALIEII